MNKTCSLSQKWSPKTTGEKLSTYKYSKDPKIWRMGHPYIILDLLVLIPFKLQHSQLIPLWKSSRSGCKKRYCHFYSCQINKDDIWLQSENNEKNPTGGVVIQKNQKQKPKADISTIDAPQGCKWCQKMRQDLLSMSIEVWCTKIAPKLKDIRKCLRKLFFFNFDNFRSLCLFWAILV